MQYLILLACIGGFVCFIFTVLSVKKRSRFKIILFSFLTMVMASISIWYLSPSKYSLKEDVNITIIYNAKDKVIKADSTQVTQLKSLINNLYYKRQFFNGYEHLMFSNDEYVYVLITDVTGEQPPLGLHMTLNKEGFTQGKGYCFDTNYAEVTNANALIQYVKECLNQG